MGESSESGVGPVVAAVAGAGVALLGGLLAWGRREREGAPREAPGGPGDAPRWFFADKCGVGTAVTPSNAGTSLVWFTLARGVLSEVFYARLDRACTRDLTLFVGHGDDPIASESEDAHHQVAYLEDGALAYRLTNTDARGRFRITKEIFTHPYQEVVLQRVRFEPLRGELADFRLYAALNPHLGGRGRDNTAWVGEQKGVPMLLARRGSDSLALAGSAPWLRGSAGFVGTSGGREDLRRHGRMTWEYDRAEGGNVELIGEVDLAACGGAFVLSLGFGPVPAEAGLRALAGLRDDFDELREEYLQGWRRWQGGLRLPPTDPGGRDLDRLGAAVLRAHQGKTVPGAMIASFATPWGEAKGDDLPGGAGGYHLVWPRDLVMAAGGLLAVGARDEARRSLLYLRDAQAADGHWPQNMWISSDHFWGGDQLGETAMPLLLLDLLRRDGALTTGDLRSLWPMTRRAAGYLVRQGPSTQEDRWENQQGFTPFTIAVVVPALLIAAELADEQGEPGVAAFLREMADAWNAAIESWLYVTDTELARRVGVEGYYVRIVPPRYAEGSSPAMGRVRIDGPVPHDQEKDLPFSEVVSPDALALVRFGLRAADDPRIRDTIRVVDALLKVETPRGPSWRRYNGDGYGEHEDGAPLADINRRGIGRAWPLLTGERAHYELIAGRPEEAARLLRAFAAFADDGGMIPEQVWDADDVPAHHRFKGRPTGSAMPLAWAQAEYLKLRRSLAEGRPYDMPPQAARRYLVDRVGSDRVIWRPDHPKRALCPGEVLRVELPEPAEIRWSADGGAPAREIRTRGSGLGPHVADLPTADLPAGARIRFTVRGIDADKGPGEEFAVEVVAAR